MDAGCGESVEAREPVLETFRKCLCRTPCLVAVGAGKSAEWSGSWISGLDSGVDRGAIS